MSLFPFATTEDLTLTDQEVIASSIREYEIDFEKGTLTGRIVTGVDALCVWAYLPPLIAIGISAVTYYMCI